jgi:ATP-dependent Lon protease
MPGKLIQALKQVQTMNPVIMLDEVDKIGNSFHGDPASALLEVLDPEQNTSFLDHYLDVRTDLSNVLFICTANILDTIPEPLKDRMEMLRLSGYIMEEKVEIAKKYLVPRNRKAMGLKSGQLRFSDTSLRALINGYARESGVRGLENQIKKIMRKVAIEVVEHEEARVKKRKPLPPFVIVPDKLKDYLGQPVFTSDRYYDRTPIGVSMGLAWTAYGGATLYVEAIRTPSEKMEMILTGQAGDVMIESSQIAWSYLHASVQSYAPGYRFFEKSQVHLHIPEGATPKDGPSAGITMTTSMLSLLTNTPVSNDLAMTGELTLTGRVLPIGGVREKVIAARRAKVHTLIFPKENERDYEELPEYIRRGLRVHFVEHYDEVVPIAFPDGFEEKKTVERGQKKKTGRSRSAR